MDVLTGIGMGIWFAALFARALGRIPFHKTSGCYAIACGLWSIDDIRTGAQMAAVVTAAACAAFAYLWWTGGGGRQYSPPSSFPAPQVPGRAPHRPATHLSPFSAF